MGNFDEKNEFEKSLAEIEKQNKHGNDSGFYVAEVEPPVGLKNIYKKPVFLFGFSGILIIPIILETSVGGFSIQTLLNHSIPTLATIVLFIAGILRVKENRRI
ncbi:MAG: hypothetical protein ACRCWG_12485 [Sarcina sp.]